MIVPLQSVYAAGGWGSCLESTDVATIQCLEPLLGRMIQGVSAFVGVALFVMLVVGGYRFLFSGGDQKKLEQAKGTLTGAVIGLFVIICAYLILKTVSVFTGVSGVTTVTIPTPQ